MSGSDDDDDATGPPMSGFVWGNIQPETGRLDDDDRLRYPEPFREQVENDRIQAIAQIVRSGPEEPDVVDSNIQIIPSQIYADYDVIIDSSSDDEDYDHDETDAPIKGELSGSVQRGTTTIGASGVTSTPEIIIDELNPSSSRGHKRGSSNEIFDADQVMADSSNILCVDENGEEILRFSTLFAPAIIDDDYHVMQNVVPIVKCQSHRATDEDDCIEFQNRDNYDLSESDFNESTSVTEPILADPHPNLAVGHKPESALIVTPEFRQSMFTLVEQTDWDRNISWDEGGDNIQSSAAPTQKELSSPNQKELSSPTQKELSLLNPKELSISEKSSKTDSISWLNEHSSMSQNHALPKHRDRIAAFRLVRGPRRRYEMIPVTVNRDRLPTCWGSDFEGEPQPRRRSVEPLALNRLRPNFDLEAMDWLDDIVWDDEGRRSKRRVPILLDLNDDWMMFDEGEDDPEPDDESVSKPSAERFNLSLDQGTLYSSYRDDLGAVVGKTGLQHALFAKNLIEVLFPTDRTAKQWSNWHHPKFDLRSALGLRATSSKNAASHSQINIAGQQRKFVPRRLRDVTARDGNLVLVEYIEAEPLLMQTTGMATELVTFYRQRNSSDSWEPHPAHGTTKIVSADMDDETPFLGKIRPGFCVTALNNNLFVVPVALHQSRPIDFLMVLSSPTATAFTLQELPATYVAGQIQPKMEVPSLNSRAASSFMKRRLTVYMHRRLQNTGALQIAEVFAAFPGQSETAIRAKLKEVAEFQRSGDLSGWWTPRVDRPPVRESALWEMVTPEAMCAYDRMEAGRQALKDLFGIELLATLTASERVFIARMAPDHPLKRAALYIEQQTRMTPWNLSHNFLSAVKGVCLLRLRGPGNPIINGAGLCYLRAPTRAEPDPIEEKLGPASALTGTNKDLRKLDMNGLRDVLLSFGVPQERIDKLLRWERVDLVRLKATEAARDGQDNEWSRFARSQRNTYRAQAAQFLKDAQRVLEKQVAFITSTQEPELKPEDEEEVDEMEEWAKDLESMMETELKDDDAVEYDKWMKQKKSAEPLKNKVEDKTEKRKKTVLRRRLKKTVTTLNQTSGETTMTVTMIDDENLIDAFLHDRAKFDAICAERPVPVAKDKAQLRLGSKKRRRGRSSAHDVLPPRRTPTLPMPESKKRGRPKGSKKQQQDTSTTVISSVPVIGLDVPFVPTPSAIFKAPLAPDADDALTVKQTTKKAITVRCSRCKQIGHTKSNSKCPMLSAGVGVIIPPPECDVTRYSPTAAV